jgi:hypothetical protein
MPTLRLIRGALMTDPVPGPEFGDLATLKEGVEAEWRLVDDRARASALAELLFAAPEQGQERRAS